MPKGKNKKQKSSIIQVSIGILAVILAILIIIMMGIVSDIQGTARIVNYTSRRIFHPAPAFYSENQYH